MLEMTDEEFLNATLTGTSLVYFSGSWCKQCGPMKTLLKQVEPDYPDVQFMHVDVDTNPQAMAICDVGAIPMLVLIRDGKILKDFLGFVKIDTLGEWLRV